MENPKEREAVITVVAPGAVIMIGTPPKYGLTKKALDFFSLAAQESERENKGLEEW